MMFAQMDDVLQRGDDRESMNSLLRPVTWPGLFDSATHFDVKS